MEQSNLPPLKAVEDLEAQQKELKLLPDSIDGIDIGADILDFKKPFKEDVYLFEYKGVKFSPLGSIQGITGQSGHGKTWLTSIIIATVLNGSFQDLKCALGKGYKNRTVLYCDTEMGEGYAIGFKYRVCKMTGRNPLEEQTDFHILELRDTLTSHERWLKILAGVIKFKPTMLVIDGLLDILSDFNDNRECLELIYKIMAVSTRFKMSIWSVVHQNPNSTKLVGHAGSFLERKCSDLLTVKKEGEIPNISFSVKHTKVRGADVPDWSFRVLSCNGFGIAEIIDKSGQIDNIDVIRAWLADAKNKLSWPATGKAIKEFFKKNGVGGSDRQQRDLDAARNRRFLLEQPREEWKSGQKHPKYILNIDN